MALCQMAELGPVMARANARHNLVATIRREWRSFLVLGAITWAVALVLNLALIAFRYGGAVDGGAPVVARGNLGGAAVLWTALTALVTSVVAYRVRVGKARFWGEVREFPVMVRTAAVADGRHTATHLLWGFAGTMLVVVTLAPALVAVLAIGTVFFLAGPARAIVVATSTAVWRRLGRGIAAMRTTPPQPVAVVLGACGTGLAFLLGALVSGTAGRIAFAALAAVTAVVLARRATAVVGLLVVLALPFAGMVARPAASAAQTKTGTIVGTVKDARGQGVPGIKVTANGRVTKSAETAGTESRYTIEKIAQGTYRVVPRDPKDDRVRFTPEYLDVDLGASVEAHFVVNAAGGGGGGETATTLAPTATTTEGAAKTTAAPATTAAPKTTTPKTPRTLSSGSSVVADFVIKTATKNLKPAPTPSAAEAAAAGTAASKPVPTTTPKPRPPSPSNTVPRPPPFTLPAAPIAADCRDVRGRACYPKAGFVEFTLSRKILKVGERATGSVSFDLVYNEAADDACKARMASGGVERCPVYSWSWAPPSGMTAIGGSPAKATKQRLTVAGKTYTVVECQSGKEIAAATCEWIASSATSGWDTRTGAVLQGFASGSFLDSDFYAVVPADVAVIEGRVRDEEGNPVPRVVVHMDGPQKYTAVTDDSGWYFHIVEPGDYDIYAEVEPALGFGKPRIVPAKHETKLKVPKDGLAAPGDLEVTGPCTGLDCLLDPTVLLLAALGLAPVVPGSMLALGLAQALGDLATPAGELLDKLPKRSAGGGGGDADGEVHRPDFRDYPPKDKSDYMEVRKRMQEDWNQYLRESNPDLTWEEILRTHDPVKEANKLFGTWLITDYAGKPLAIAEDVKHNISGFLELMGIDNEMGGFWNRVKHLPGVAIASILDIAWGPPDPKTGLRGWGGLYGIAAEEIERHGPFAVFPLAFRYAANTVNSITGDAGLYTVHFEATLHMTEVEREKYFRDHASEIPYFGWMYEYAKAVESGDDRAIARSSFDLAQRMSGYADARPDGGWLPTASELERRVAAAEAKAARQAYRDRYGHDPDPVPDGPDGVGAEGLAADAALADGATKKKPSVWDKATPRPEHQMIDLRSRASKVEVPDISPETLRARELLFERARKTGELRITSEQAHKYLGIEKRLLDDRTDTILRYSEGAAGEGIFTAYKLGDESALVSVKLRTEHPEIWTGKWNPVSDKSWIPGEEAFVSEADLARFRANPPLPSEIVNYTPKELSPAEFAALSDVLQERYLKRHEHVTNWAQYSSPSHPKVVDYSDPRSIERYGPMFVVEDAGKPVVKAEFWRDPDDLRIYVRYQTEDGKWHPPRRQSSDVDTIAHGAGSGSLTHAQQRDLQYKLSMGQLGEGDTARYAMSIMERDGASGAWALKNPADKDMLVKAIDTLVKGEKEFVLRQDLDGLKLTRQKFPELAYLKEAAQTIDAAGGWDADVRRSLASYGVFD